jgi:prostaglandin-H2 D-isomerase / glutathione transferase
LYPTNNPLAALMVDEIMLAVDEFGESFRPWFTAQDPVEKQAEEVQLLAVTIPKYLTLIDARLAKMKEHVTFRDPSRLFIHELWVYQYLRTMLQADWLAFVPNDVHKNHKHWVETEAKVENHPRVHEWNTLQPMRPQKLKLTYFDFGGRAEPIRLAFHVGGIAFEDNRIQSRESFLELQPEMPFGRVPTLEIDGKVTMSQSFAILRYAGGLAGLYPSDADDLAALRIDELLAVLDQLQNIWYPAFATQDPEKQRALREVVVKETIPQYLGGLDKRVAGWAKPYATGEKLTIADLAIYGIIDFLKSSEQLSGTVVGSFPALLTIHALVRADAKVAAYYKERESKS